MGIVQSFYKNELEEDTNNIIMIDEENIMTKSGDIIRDGSEYECIDNVVQEQPKKNDLEEKAKKIENDNSKKEFSIIDKCCCQELLVKINKLKSKNKSLKLDNRILSIKYNNLLKKKNL